MSFRPSKRRLQGALQPVFHAAQEVIHGGSFGQEVGGGYLLGLGRPGPHVAQNGLHLFDDGRRAEAVAHAHAGGGKALRNAVDVDDVVAQLGAQAHGVVVLGIAEGEQPVNLVVENVEGLFIGAAALVFGNHQVADFLQAGLW